MDQGIAADGVRRVLVLGGATEDSIGHGIVMRLNELGHKTEAPDADVLDVTTVGGYNALMELLEFFRPDSVVYSVGVNELEWSAYLERESFDRIMGANVWGFINVMKALQATGLPYSVLALTSDAAYRAMRTSIAYCASKAALDMAIRVASRELAGEGWRVNGLAPGKVDGTGMTKYVDARVMEIRHFETREEAERYEMAGNPLHRKLSVDEVARVACDVLLSTAMGWTGDIVTVNGGR